MYRKIDKYKIVSPIQSRRQVKRDALHYVRNRQIYAQIRQAYLDNQIDCEQLKELQGLVRAGDGAGAENGLRKLVYGGV